MTAKTKGAISNQEMDMFGEAVANDDISSLPRIRTALARIGASISNQEKVAKNQFRAVYGDESLNDVLSRYASPQNQTKNVGSMTNEEIMAELAQLGGM